MVEKEEIKIFSFLEEENTRKQNKQLFSFAIFPQKTRRLSVLPTCAATKKVYSRQQNYVKKLFSSLCLLQ